MQIQLWMRKEEIPAGSHLCQLYPKVEDVAHVATALFVAATDARYRCTYVGATAVVASLEHGLKQAGLSPERLRESGQLVISDQRDAYLVNNRFDPYHMVSHHMTTIRQSQLDGWQGAAVGLDMTWLTDGVASNAQTLKYEALCDAVFTFQAQPIVAVAQYNLPRLGADMSVEMNKLHPLSIIGRHLRRNPSYVNSDQYMMNILRATRPAGR